MEEVGRAAEEVSGAFEGVGGAVEKVGGAAEMTVATARIGDNNGNELYFLCVWGADVNYLESCPQLKRKLHIFDTQ